MMLSPAIITAISTIVGAIISGVVSLTVASKQNNKTMALVIYRLEQLEHKQDKHNSLMERVFKLEAEVDALEK